MSLYNTTNISFVENVTRGSQKPSPVFPVGAIVQYLLICCVWQLYVTNHSNEIGLYVLHLGYLVSVSVPVFLSIGYRHSASVSSGLFS